MSKITIYEIAKEAGCSATTVSRIINNYPYVKKSTRNKVLKIIENKNYIPNETARNLVTQSTKMIAILIADIRTAHHTDGIYHIEKELSKNGYSCLICNTGHSSKSMMDYFQIVSQKNVDAIILMGSIYQNKDVEMAIEQFVPNIPIVFCNGYINRENVYGIISDEYVGVRECVKLLYSKGRSNLGFVYDNETPSNLLKKEGFIHGLEEAGYHNADNKIMQINSDKKNDLKAFFKENPELDGLIASEDYLGLSVLQVLNELNIKVPEQIAVIGINNSRYAEIAIPPLTSLDNKLYDSSIAVARTILSLLKGETACKKVILCTDIVERQST